VHIQADKENCLCSQKFHFINNSMRNQIQLIIQTHKVKEGKEVKLNSTTISALQLVIVSITPMMCTQSNRRKKKLWETNSGKQLRKKKKKN